MAVHALRVPVPSTVPGLVPADSHETSRTVHLSGHRHIRLTEYNPGCAHKIVTLHGLGASPHVMRVFAEIAATCGVTAIALDLPGHGRSSNPNSFEDLVDMIVELCDLEGLHDTVFVGHSLGALVIPFLAQRRPELVSHAVLLALPTHQPSSRIEFGACMVTLAADVTVTTLIAWGDALFGRSGPAFSLGLFRTIAYPPRLRRLLRLLRAVVYSEELMKNLHYTLINGGADLAIRRPSQSLGLQDPAILRFQPHCFPLLERNWSIIIQSVRQALEGTDCQELATVTPIRTLTA